MMRQLHRTTAADPVDVIDGGVDFLHQGPMFNPMSSNFVKSLQIDGKGFVIFFGIAIKAVFLPLHDYIRDFSPVVVTKQKGIKSDMAVILEIRVCFQQFINTGKVWGTQDFLSQQVWVVTVSEGIKACDQGDGSKAQGLVGQKHFRHGPVAWFDSEEGVALWHEGYGYERGLQLLFAKQGLHSVKAVSLGDFK